ncbi:QueC-like queuosine biosynthesis [Vibrio phage K251 g3]
MQDLIAIPTTAKNESCVLVFSGGQDSTTCLGVALEHFKHVHCVTFDYGQTHAVELHCARAIVNMYENVDLTVLPIDTFRTLGDSALIRGAEQKDVNADHNSKTGLPASFVPNRNATFLTLAHAYAQKVGADWLMTGVCETDYSGYPDCRRVFIQALETTLNLGSNSTIKILTPLMNLSKAETFELAEEYGFIDTVLNMSHTCYNGKRDGEHYHEWGHGCGECPACELRAKGWEEFLNGKDA